METKYPILGFFRYEHLPMAATGSGSPSETEAGLRKVARGQGLLRAGRAVMRDRTASAEWDDLSAHRTVRDVWTIPAPAIRRVARVVLGSLGAAILVVAVLRWAT